MGLPPKQRISRIRIRPVVAGVLRWYRRHARTLPWRNTRDPYRILVSEYMLQQTQVSRVLNMYPLFLSRFPTTRALASASQRQVLRTWQGMGYNNRAVRLHRAAHTIVGGRGGRFPREYKALIALPGVGKYTAHAILVFAFDRQLPVVDLNIRRVLSRVFWRMRSPADLRHEDDIWELAAHILPNNRAGVWNQALMDFGAIICTARKPSCDRCPIANHCLSRPSMSRPTPQVSRNEPSFRGIPNRIYRGWIVKRLCLLPDGQSTPLDTLGASIAPAFTERNRQWLIRLLEDLETDGLVRLRGNGAFHTRRVSLA
jgi:A/G-specific adenine glycosylase